MKQKKLENNQIETLDTVLERWNEQAINQIEKKMKDQPEHVFSDDFQLTMSELIENRKKKNRIYWVTYAMRRVAVVALILTSLCITTGISAKVFGFNPWFIKVTDTNVATTKVYHLKDTKTPELAVKKVANEPIGIPAGYEKQEYLAKKDEVSVIWENPDHKQIAYGQIRIEDGMISMIKTKDKSRRKVKVARYPADVIYEGDQVRLDWNDEVYTYFLYADGLKIEELIQLAESIYSVRK